MEGYGYPHSKTQYAGRLFGFAVLAQLPYQLVFPEHGMAGMLGLTCCLRCCSAFWCWPRREKIHSGFFACVLHCTVDFASIFCDWALLAPVFTLLFAWAENSRLRKHVAFGVAAVLYGGMAWLSSMRTLVRWAPCRIPWAARCQFWSPAFSSCICITASGRRSIAVLQVVLLRLLPGPFTGAGPAAGGAFGLNLAGSWHISTPFHRLYCTFAKMRV